MIPANKIICGDALEVLKTFPAGSINCCVSSPPFWALRNYGLEPQIWDGDNCEHKWGAPVIRKQSGGTEKTNVGNYKDDRIHYTSKTSFCSLCSAWRGSLGLEPTFELYIKHLCDIYDEVKRVLRPDGTCWVNLGDTYGGTKVGNTETQKYKSAVTDSFVKSGGLEKSLCCIPDRFRIEMLNRGWILRNKIIWAKNNPMPSSAKDRFTVDFEEVMFFVKSKRYWFETQYEPILYDSVRRERRASNQGDKPYAVKTQKEFTGYNGINEDYESRLGRNKRCVWTIPTQAFSEAHFATFPEKLVEPMIKAGCPEFVCKKCGKAREKILKLTSQNIKKRNLDNKTGEVAKSKPMGIRPLPQSVTGLEFVYKREYVGYTDCGCGEKFRNGIVLDPFAVRARPCWSLPRIEGIISGLN